MTDAANVSHLPGAAAARRRLERQRRQREEALRRREVARFGVLCRELFDEEDARERREMDERVGRFALQPMTRREFEMLAAYRAAPDDKREIVDAVINAIRAAAPLRRRRRHDRLS